MTYSIWDSMRLLERLSRLDHVPLVREICLHSGPYASGSRLHLESSWVGSDATSHGCLPTQNAQKKLGVAYPHTYNPKNPHNLSDVELNVLAWQYAKTSIQCCILIAMHLSELRKNLIKLRYPISVKCRFLKCSSFLNFQIIFSNLIYSFLKLYSYGPSANTYFLIIEKKN